jgi:hypothetical protein
MPGPRNPPVANTVVGGRGGKHLSTRRLVADKGELGEDHSECTSDQQLQPGLVEEDQHRSPHPLNAVSKPANSMESAAQGGRSWTVRVEDPGDINGSRRHPQIIDRCEAEGVTNTLDVWEICWGDPDSEWLAQSSVDVFGHATTHQIQRPWRRLSTDSSIRRSRRPRFVAAAASRPVRSCDNASSGACEVRAATSPPRSVGSGLYAPPRGHDQGRARERWPRGVPVPLARLAG